LLYTRSKAKTRCDFGKDQGLARRKGKKERVTPEFGEKKEEKILPPNSGCYTQPLHFSQQGVAKGFSERFRPLTHQPNQETLPCLAAKPNPSPPIPLLN
jgi:hypothetical protein